MYYNYQENGAKSFVGTLYSYDFATGGVRNILSSTIRRLQRHRRDVAHTSITYSETAWQSGRWRDQADRRLALRERELHVHRDARRRQHASDYRDGTLIGVNVRTVNATSSSTGSSTVAINGHQDGRAFRVDGLASTNGFLGTQYYAAYLGFMYTYTSRYDHYYLQHRHLETASPRWTTARLHRPACNDERLAPARRPPTTTVGASTRPTTPTRTRRRRSSSSTATWAATSRRSAGSGWTGSELPATCRA